MKPNRHIAGKPAKTIAVALLAAATLAACGGHFFNSGGDDDTPTPVVDAYFTAVSALLASSPDDTEPVAIDSIVATAPEDIEPQPLG